METIKSWWDAIDLAKLGKGTIENAAHFSLFSTAIKDNKCVYTYANSGNLSTTPELIVEDILKLGGRIISKPLLQKSRSSSSYSDHYLDDTFSQSYYFVWDDSIVHFYVDNDWNQIEAQGLNEELVLSIKAIGDRFLTKKTRGKAYIISRSAEGFALQQVPGEAGIKLEIDNYSKQTIDDFNYIVQEIKSKTPAARFVGLLGNPGVGKSFFIRGLMDEIDNAMFVLIHPSLINDIMGPNLVPMLLDYHKKNQAIVFIIEDADAVIAKRESDNINSISSLLNLGDGIFGALFNCFVVCTSNSDMIELDPALLRPGRCLRMMEMGSLSYGQALKVYRRLKNDNNAILDKKSYTLAEIYNLARNKDYVEITKKLKIGF